MRKLFLAVNQFFDWVQVIDPDYIKTDQDMEPKKLESWLLFSIILLVTSIFILEVVTSFGVLGTVAYLLIVIYFLWLPHKQRYVISLAALTSIYIIVGYLIASQKSVVTDAMLANRIFSLIAIWVAVYFTTRFRLFLDAQLKQKSHLNAVFENATEGMIVANARGEIVTVNKFAEQLFGYGRNELLGQKVEKIIPKRFAEKHHEHRDKFFHEPHTRPMGAGRDLYGLHKDGFEIPVEVSLSHFKSNNETFVVAFIVNITERKKASENLRREKELAQMYLDIAPVVFLVLNTKGNVELINQYGCDMIGYKETDVLSKNWIEVFIPEHAREECFDSLSKLVKGDKVVNLEIPVTTVNGFERVISWKGSLITDENGQTKSILLSGEDVTEKKEQETLNLRYVENIKRLNEELEDRVEERTQALAQAMERVENTNRDLKNQISERKIIEEKLLSSQRLYKAIAHNFPDGLIGVLNKEFRYILVDGKELKNLNLDPKNLLGQKIFDKIAPEATEYSEKFIKAAFNGEINSYELNIKDRIYNIVAVPLPDLRDEINEILIVMQNITSRKTMEEGLRNALEKERELGELKSRFVTMASHEFRTPLSTILSSVFLLENFKGDAYEKQKTLHINRIQKAVKNLTEILNDFLSIGKLEEGRVNINYEKVNLKEFIQEFIPEIESVKKNDQIIEYLHKGDEYIVNSDKQLLKNILNNLVSNAIKYSNPGDKIQISSALNHASFTLEIKDEGIGIPEPEQKNIFNRFYRANNATNIQGTGLGLNIVSKYVELLKGSISFESKQNEGTTFTVRLPA